MTVERVMLPCIRYTEGGQTRHMLPMRDDAGSWWQLTEDGVTWHRTIAEVREFVADWQADLETEGTEPDPSEVECWEAYEALAQLMEELESQ